MRMNARDYMHRHACRHPDIFCLCSNQQQIAFDLPCLICKAHSVIQIRTLAPVNAVLMGCGCFNHTATLYECSSVCSDMTGPKDNHVERDTSFAVATCPSPCRLRRRLSGFNRLLLKRLQHWQPKKQRQQRRSDKLVT